MDSAYMRNMIKAKIGRAKITVGNNLVDLIGNSQVLNASSSS